MLLLSVASCALAQSQQRPPRDTSKDQNTQAIPYEDYKRDFGAIAKELATIRQQQASAESERTKYKYSWWTNGDPPVWSNWAVVIAAVVAGVVAYIQFRHQRDAVHLTQRADILLHSVSFMPKTKPVVLTGETQLSFYFKNYGPTRASNVSIQTNIEIVGRSMLITPTPNQMPPTVVAGGKDTNISYPPLKIAWDDESIRLASSGKAPLRFTATLTYTDVFGKPHHTYIEARYHGGSGSFLTERMDAD